MPSLHSKGALWDSGSFGLDRVHLLPFDVMRVWMISYGLWVVLVGSPLSPGSYFGFLFNISAYALELGLLPLVDYTLGVMAMFLLPFGWLIFDCSFSSLVDFFIDFSCPFWMSLGLSVVFGFWWVLVFHWPAGCFLTSFPGSFGVTPPLFGWCIGLFGVVCVPWLLLLARFWVCAPGGSCFGVLRTAAFLSCWCAQVLVCRVSQGFPLWRVPVFPWGF